MSVSLKNWLNFNSGHAALFRDLCQYHQLNKTTKLLLLQIVKELGIERPAMIFIDPAILTKAMSLPSMADSVNAIQELFYTCFDIKMK
jgi:hypothetical protein